MCVMTVLMLRPDRQQSDLVEGVYIIFCLKERGREGAHDVQFCVQAGMQHDDA